MPTLTESIRKFSNIVILNEGIKDDVKNMFVGMDIGSNDKEWLDKEFDWARKTFVSNRDVPNKDRLMWYMRFVKLHLLEKGIDNSPERQKIYNKSLQRAATKAGDSTTDIAAGISYAMRSAFKIQMEHFLSMEIHSIQKMTFGWEAPQKLVAHMEAAEKDWQDDQRAIVEIEKGDEILIDFKNGYAWWNLHRGSCDSEAKAMGHCGNSAGHHGDNILSLRRKIIGADKEEYWAPLATFILDKNDILGEMKGRFNNKPGEELHPYIIALLKNNIVEGIKGGGYLPSHNFNLNDLDEDDREKLLLEKPELGGIGWLFDKEGYSDRFASRLEDTLQAKGLMPNYLKVISSSNNKDKNVIINEWTDFSSFLGDINDDDLYKILEFYEEGPDLDDITPDMDYYIELLEKLPTKYQELISDEIGVDITTGNRNDIRDAIETMKTGPREYYRFIEYMNKTITGAETIDKDKQDKIKHRIQEYIEAGFSFYSPYVWLDIDKDNFKKHIKAIINLSDLIGYAEADEDDEYDYNDYGDIYNIKQHGYTGVDWENMNELRGKYNTDLVDEQGNDKKLKDIMTIENAEYDLSIAVSKFIKLFDTNETRITEEVIIEYMNRLSKIIS